MPAAPKIRIDLASPTPAVRQIVDQLRVLLVEGDLKPGAHLPSVRRIAIDLGIHFNTVAEAYRQLAAEGWLDLKHGRGAVVVERSPPAAPGRKVADFRQRLRELISEMRAQGVPIEKIANELRAQAEPKS